MMVLQLRPCRNYASRKFQNSKKFGRIHRIDTPFSSLLIYLSPREARKWLPERPASKCAIFVITAMQFHPKLKILTNSLKECGKITKQIICAVMRKPVHEIFGVLKYDFLRIKNFNATS